jgi:carbamoylphosphate synthase large subunit
MYDTVAHGGKRIEINTVDAIKISSNKKLMKQAFIQADVCTADMWTDGALNDWANENFPIVAKHIYGSRGEGNTLLHNMEQLNKWINNKNLSN